MHYQEVEIPSVAGVHAAIRIVLGLVFQSIGVGGDALPEPPVARRSCRYARHVGSVTEVVHGLTRKQFNLAGSYPAVRQTRPSRLCARAPVPATCRRRSQRGWWIGG